MDIPQVISGIPDLHSLNSIKWCIRCNRILSSVLCCPTPGSCADVLLKLRQSWHQFFFGPQGLQSWRNLGDVDGHPLPSSKSGCILIFRIQAPPLIFLFGRGLDRSHGWSLENYMVHGCLKPSPIEGNIYRKLKVFCRQRWFPVFFFFWKSRKQPIQWCLPVKSRDIRDREMCR